MRDMQHKKGESMAKRHMTVYERMCQKIEEAGSDTG